MYKIFIRRGLSFAVGYPSPWVILRRGLSFAMGYPSPWVILRRGLSFAVAILRRGHITATTKAGSARGPSARRAVFVEERGCKIRC